MFIYFKDVLINVIVLHNISNLILYLNHLGFSNVSIYVSKENDIEEIDILNLTNLTAMENEMDEIEYRAELKKFKTKYPFCSSYNEEPTFDDVVIDIDCQFPFEVRYVLLIKNSISEPSYLTLNDIQFRLKGILHSIVKYAI